MDKKLEIERHSDLAQKSMYYSVRKALEKKARLGHYAVMYKDGKIVKLNSEEIFAFLKENE
jgi:hypothetical protein